MNKKYLFVGAGIIVILLLGFAGVGHAQQFRSGDNATVNSNETINSTAYLAGKNVDVAGTIEGDLFCAGQNVTISGTVDGDVICAGQNVTISGRVNGNVRVVGQTVAIESKITNNLTVGGQDFTLDSNGSIGGDVTGGVDSMIINGRIGRDIVLGAHDAVINGVVGRNIKSNVQNLSLDANARIGGNLDYTSSNELNKTSSAVVIGNIVHSEPAVHHASKWFGLGLQIYLFVTLLITALIMVLLLPTFFDHSAKRTLTSPGKTLLLGIAATLFTPVVVVLLTITAVGVPLGIILLLGWIVALMLSGVFFSFLVGRLVWKKQKSHVLTMLIGVMIVLLAYNIPIIGLFATLATIFMGMGMAVREVTTRIPKPNYTAK